MKWWKGVKRKIPPFVRACSRRAAPRPTCHKKILAPRSTTTLLERLFPVKDPPLAGFENPQ
jgi:hypothetical protein